MSLRVVGSSVEGVVDDGEIVLLKIVEKGDDRVEFGDEILLLRLGGDRPRFDADGSGPLAEAWAIGVGGGQAAGDLDDTVAEAELPVLPGAKVEFGAGNGQGVEDVEVEVEFHDPAGEPVEDHRRKDAEQVRLIRFRAA